MTRTTYSIDDTNYLLYTVGSSQNICYGNCNVCDCFSYFFLYTHIKLAECNIIKNTQIRKKYKERNTKIIISTFQTCCMHYRILLLTIWPIKESINISLKQEKLLRKQSK